MDTDLIPGGRRQSPGPRRPGTAEPLGWRPTPAARRGPRGSGPGGASPAGRQPSHPGQSSGRPSRWTCLM